MHYQKTDIQQFGIIEIIERNISKSLITTMVFPEQPARPLTYRNCTKQKRCTIHISLRLMIFSGLFNCHPSDPSSENSNPPGPSGSYKGLVMAGYQGWFKADGSPAYVFSSYDESTVDLHFKMLRKDITFNPNLPKRK
jgi:hypothetical protein